MATTDPAKTGDQDVFGSLPSSRPQRRSAKRDSGTRARTTAGPAQAKTTKAKPKTAAKAKAKPKAAASTRAKPKATAKPKTAAKPKATAKPKGTAKPKTAAKPKPRARAKPQAAPRSTVPPAGYATPRADEVPSGRGDLIGTAMQAAGELTQIGLAAGSRALSSALKRLPRP
jgi:outer membrane biosynthesis protein TonB